MEFEDLLQGLAKKLNCGSLTADESGSVSLLVDEMPVTIINLDELKSVAFAGEIGEPPPEDRIERLYRALLVANHNFTGTGGATLSIDNETGRVMLCRIMPIAAIDPDEFFTNVESFVNTLETWRRIVTEFSGAASAEFEDGAQPSAEGGEDAPPPNPLMGGSFMQV